MPTSLSLHDLSLRKNKNSNCNFDFANLSTQASQAAQSQRRYCRTDSEKQQKLKEGISNSTIIKIERCGNDGIIRTTDEDRKIEEAVNAKQKHVELLTFDYTVDSRKITNLCVPEAESEQIICESGKPFYQHDKEAKQWPKQDIHDTEQLVNVEFDVDDDEGMLDDCGSSLTDFPLFPTSSMGVYEFSLEFLSIARKHRFQPKAKAILLDLLQRAMPEANRCPQTISEMRKLVACDEKTHSLFGGSLPSTSKNFPQTIRPQSHYLLPSDEQCPSTSQNTNSSKAKSSLHRYYASDIGPSEEDYYILDEEEQHHYEPGILHYDEPQLLSQIIQTINRLSNEVAILRGKLQTQSTYGTIRKAKRRSVFSDARVGLHIYDLSNNKVLLNELAQEELRSIIDVCRNDENRLVYGDDDITETVLSKIDLVPYLQNPSLCGRMVADVLFSPEYLSDKHILAEGQISSRARLEHLPPEMTQLFYECLRKLGVARIAEEDQEHWMYLARDGVNQRARDLKANRKRKFYAEEPIFTEDQI